MELFLRTFFSGKFQSNCSSRFLFAAGSEILYSKISLSNTMKASLFRVLYKLGFLKRLKMFKKNANVGVLFQ